MKTSKPTLSATSNERWESVSHTTPRFSRTPVLNLSLRLIHWAVSPPSPSPPSSPFPRPGYHDFWFFYMSIFRLHKWGNCRVISFWVWLFPSYKSSGFVHVGRVCSFYDWMVFRCAHSAHSLYSFSSSGHLRCAGISAMVHSVDVSLTYWFHSPLDKYLVVGLVKPI